MTPILFSLFVLGLIIGSFLNVVILRFDTGLKISRGRSKCFSCNKLLKWYELLPLVSFTAQKGKCRGCKSKISWQYPFVELATAIILPLIYLRTLAVNLDLNNLILFGLISLLFFFYIVIFVYDLRHKIIPDLFSYSAAMIAFAIFSISICSYMQITGSMNWYGLAAGPLLFFFFFFFWAVSKGRWMGFGDAKLALSVGWFLGFGLGISAILISFWIGALTVILMVILQKTKIIKGHLGLKSAIPFGPFIIIAVALVYLFPYQVTSFLGLLAL